MHTQRRQNVNVLRLPDWSRYLCLLLRQLTVIQFEPRGCVLTNPLSRRIT